MKKKDFFAEYHPVVNLIYFGMVMGYSLWINHPLAQGISLICGGIYYGYAEERKNIIFLLKIGIPMVLLTAFVNPAFNHEGTTILCYLSNGNPLTLESILYGIFTGIMLSMMMLWCASFQRVMTSDKFIYLFGKVIPALSLVLSMTLRFVPKFKDQMELVVQAQRGIGRDLSHGSMWKRMKTAVVIFSIMITLALENAIETADSMKSRGYGLKGRTAFCIYKFRERDKYVLMWFLVCGLYLSAGMVLRVFGFRYFPNIRYADLNSHTLGFYLVYLGLCITPVVLNIREEKRWKILYSKM